MKRNVRNYAGRLGWERIAFAIVVVGEYAIGTFPGILPSDRSDTQTFLTQKKSSQISAGSVAEAGRMVSEGLAAGLLQDPKRELAGALSGSGPPFVSKEIVLLLAALISGRNTIKLVSLVRPRGGPHGIPISDTEYLSQAVDIGYFNGLIDAHDRGGFTDPRTERVVGVHAAHLGTLKHAFCRPILHAER